MNLDDYIKSGYAQGGSVEVVNWPDIDPEEWERECAEFFRTLVSSIDVHNQFLQIHFPDSAEEIE